MSPEQINDLLERYTAGKATEAEKGQVESWYLAHQPLTSAPDAMHINQDQQESIALLIGQLSAKPVRTLWRRLSLAASVIILFSAGGFFFVLKKAPQQQQTVINKPVKHDAAPGGNKAILTLANGAVITLNGAKNGVLAKQGNITINKNKNGLISYQGTLKKGPLPATGFNTATTPRGGQYQLILADGTKVWLNAASSIKYPVAFTGFERRVELTGEAYFEVAHNAKMPFRVVSNHQTVEVLGTHFNINAYDNEAAIKTTLAEGSVKIITAAGKNILEPGQQARLKNGSISVTEVDVNEALAWKNGFFYFRDSNIEDVMRQLSRWYDVDVRYEGTLPARQFSGEISRDVNASQILDILSFKKIKFSIQGKILTVTQ